MEKLFKTQKGDITIHTYVEKHENGYETNSFKAFSLDMMGVAQQRKDNIKAMVIKIDLNNPYYTTVGYGDNVDFRYFMNNYIFNVKVLVDKKANLYYYDSYAGWYEFVRRFKECLPNNYKFIELDTRKDVLNRLFTDGVDGIISGASLLLRSDFITSDRAFDERIFGEALTRKDVMEEFSASDFVLMYLIGNLLEIFAGHGLKDVYFVNDYGSLVVYYDGIDKKEIRNITKDILESFNKEFSVNVQLYSIGEKNFKYLPQDNFAEDVFGNKIGTGDLVLSPQGNCKGGSWVDPIIVKGVQKDRIIPDDEYRSYYMADRCILLRSTHGVIPKYGEKDFIN